VVAVTVVVYPPRCNDLGTTTKTSVIRTTTGVGLHSMAWKRSVQTHRAGRSVRGGCVFRMNEVRIANRWQSFSIRLFSLYSLSITRPMFCYQCPSVVCLEKSNHANKKEGRQALWTGADWLFKPALTK